MATKAAQTQEFDVNADPTVSPEGWEWETKAEEAPTKVVFDTIGDVFIGKYLGKRFVENEPGADGADRSFTLHTFKGRDEETYAVNDSFDLNDKLEDIEPGTWVRLTYLKDVKTQRGLNDMKSFRVDVKK